MSTLKTDAIEAATGTNTDLSLDGKGSGVPDLGAGFKVGGSAGVPTASIRDDAVTTAKILDANVTTAKINDDAVTLAKLASGTDGELITWDASGNPAAVAVGTATHVLTSNGAGAAPTFQAAGGGFTLGTPQATTSGSSFNFGSLPSGLTMIVIMFDSVSCDDDSGLKIQIGDSGGIETSSYANSTSLTIKTSSSSIIGLTSGFPVRNNPTASAMTGHMTLTLANSSTNLWIASQVMTGQTSVSVQIGASAKTLSAELTQLTFSNSAGAFDGGAVNIMYQ